MPKKALHNGGTLPAISEHEPHVEHARKKLEYPPLSNRSGIAGTSKHSLTGISVRTQQRDVTAMSAAMQHAISMKADTKKDMKAARTEAALEAVLKKEYPGVLNRLLQAHLTGTNAAIVANLKATLDDLRSTRNTQGRIVKAALLTACVGDNVSNKELQDKLGVTHEAVLQARERHMEVKSQESKSCRAEALTAQSR